MELGVEKISLCKPARSTLGRGQWAFGVSYLPYMFEGVYFRGNNSCKY